MKREMKINEGFLVLIILLFSLVRFAPAAESTNATSRHYLSALCSAVKSPARTNHRRDAESAEDAQSSLSDRLLDAAIDCPWLEPSDQSDVRAAVQDIFNQLKAGQYEALYDSLPLSSRSRIARDRFVSGLQRTRNLYQLDRIEIGAVRVSGNLAV